MHASLLGVSTFASNDEVLLSVLFAFVFAFLGYRISARHRLLRGITPWRFPSVVWALICFVIGPFGIVVELVAEVTTRPRLPSSLGRQAGRPEAIPTALAGPAYPGAASDTRYPAASSAPLIDLAPKGPPPPRDEHGGIAAFGWYADPTKHHELRYFDGKGWSEFVADRGVSGTDPL